VTPRPNPNSNVVIRSVAKEIVDESSKWMGAAWREDMRDQKTEEVVNVLLTESDAYKRARALDILGWPNVDMQLVYILDIDPGRDLFWEAMAEWADRHGPAPLFERGHRIRFKGRDSGRELVGQIVFVDREHAWYLVTSDDAVPRDADYYGSPSGFCVPFEDAESA